jgi:nicotinate-nucleotide--dimethylbenzimidazole phosphoribosyltransferase
MQPWRFIVVRSESTKAAMQALAARERLVQAAHLTERARQYLDLKIEGIREAPVSIGVCCDRDAGGREVLGRHTIRDTDLYSTCLAIENLWLVARAEGVGVGWVSFYRPPDVRALLGLPEHVVPVAWLCIGYPDERPTRPGLEAAGWQRRQPLDEVVHSEHWPETPPPPSAQTRTSHTDHKPHVEQPAWWKELAGRVSPGNIRPPFAFATPPTKSSNLLAA